jgi:hypothetical protein
MLDVVFAELGVEVECGLECPLEDEDRRGDGDGVRRWVRSDLNISVSLVLL